MYFAVYGFMIILHRTNWNFKGWIQAANWNVAVLFIEYHLAGQYRQLCCTLE